MNEPGELVEIEPGRWRFIKEQTAPARSVLPCPNVISDIMEPVEQVDGRFYTSKRQYRAVGRAHGLTEVGTEKFKPKIRATDQKGVKEARRDDLRRAVARYKAGERPSRS
jgi:hypothetical protein